MSLSNLDIKIEYRNQLTNIAKEFLIPVLSESISYKRAVGFFSSTALIELSTGISGLMKNGGKIQLIASPHLSENDVKAIESGYEKREEIARRLVQKQILEQLPNRDSLSISAANRFNLLAWLIEKEILDIKIAFTDNKKDVGIYHEKVAIVEDAEGNKIAFSGSMNETATALKDNYEVVDVFCSWNEGAERVRAKEAGFDNIWNNNEPGVIAFDFPDVKEKIIAEYLTHEPDFESDDRPIPSNNSSSSAVSNSSDDIEPRHKYPAIPSNIILRGYQSEAISAWKEAGYRGIFDMATGTGKTITGLSAMTKLCEARSNKLAVIIVCPYQHLVEQWVEDIERFNISPIIGYSASSQSDWYRRLDDAIRNQKYEVLGSEFFCFVCTNGTYATERVQRILGKIKNEKLLIVDEAHNFGAEYLRSLLREDFDYRLALSATIIRSGDSDGTGALFDYFGERCIEYTLEEAINGRGDEPPCLTPYRYYPIVVYLEDDELERYDELSSQIAKCIVKTKSGKTKLSEKGKRLALERARLVAAAHQKLSALKTQIKGYSDDHFMLVYCGATKVTIDSGEIASADDFELRQIDAVTQILGGDMKIKVRQFTSRESSTEREEIKEMFSSERLQALIAIKCLDEGVNIPMIKTAFILASTTNPREYIQRRGRLLRKDKEGKKKFAEIYDFITLPRNEELASVLPENDIKGEKTLVYNELVRAKEFANLAQNRAQVMQTLDEIEDAYFGINGFYSYRTVEVD